MATDSEGNNAQKLYDQMQENRYAMLANQLWQEGSKRKSLSALEALAEDSGMKEGRIDGFINGLMQGGEKAIQATMSEYGSQYQEAEGGLSVNQLYDHYKDSIAENLDPEEIKRIEGEVGRLGDKKWEDVRSAYQEAEHYLNDNEDPNKPHITLSKEEKENYEKTKDSYSNVMEIVEAARDHYMDSLRPKVGDRSYKSTLKRVAENLKSENNDENNSSSENGE